MDKLDDFNANGFTILNDIIPKSEIQAVEFEAISAREEVYRNIERIKRYTKLNPNATEEELLEVSGLKMGKPTRAGFRAKPINDIIWMPKLVEYIVDHRFIGILEQILGQNIRLSQCHAKIIESRLTTEERTFIDNQGVSRFESGGSESRDWHTDWPHDPVASGGGDPGENWGFIPADPNFPVMTVVAIWFLSNCDGGGTWVIPRSHRDRRNPRNPNDGIDPLRPMSGEIQLDVRPGSVLLVDSRLWHSSPMMNNSGRPRVAVVTRWNPWWMSLDDFAQLSRFNVMCRPIPLQYFERLPDLFKPFVKHLCREASQAIDDRILARAEEAARFLRLKHQSFGKRTESHTPPVEFDAKRN